MDTTKALGIEAQTFSSGTCIYKEVDRWQTLEVASKDDGLRVQGAVS